MFIICSYEYVVKKYAESYKYVHIMNIICSYLYVVVYWAVYLLATRAGSRIYRETGCWLWFYDYKNMGTIIYTQKEKRVILANKLVFLLKSESF